MSNSHQISTDNFHVTQFRPHGRVEYEERGNLLCATAFGPFNIELMAALLELAKSTFPNMAAKGSWGHIAVFRHSALCSPDVMSGVQDAMTEMVRLGFAPQATAFVLPPEVEGYAFMGPQYATAFESAGAVFSYFHSFDDAYKWVESIAGPLHG